MIDELKLREQLKLHEGLRLESYICPGGHLTVGVGRNVEANPVEDELGRAITMVGESVSEEEAMALLDNDITRCEIEVRAAIPYFPELSENRQHVLIDMAFNLGTSGLLKFRNMLAALESRDYEQAALEMMDSKWADQVQTRADRLCDMMSTDAAFEDLV